MFKRILPFLLVVLAAVLDVTALRAAEQDRGGELEMQVAVRVFRDGAAVDNLREQDIELLIDGAPQAVSGWRNAKKRIGALAESSPRFFVLIFHLHEYPANLGQALTKLFHDLLRNDDRLLVVANQASLLIDRLTDWEKSAATVETFVKEQTRRFRQALETDRKNLAELIEKITSDYTRVTANIHRHYYMKGFKLSLEEYLLFIRQYKQRYLVPSPGLFSGLRPQLAENRGEKWIIAFWQVSEVPKIPKKNKDLVTRVFSDFQASDWYDENNYGNLIKRWLIEAESVFSEADAFPGPDIYNLFAGFAATLHAFYVPPPERAIEKDAEFRHVASQAQEILADLAKNSGGLFREFTEPENDMAAIAEKSDSYFIVNFNPVSAYKKVRINPADKKMSLWFDAVGAGGREAENRSPSSLLDAQIDLRDVALQKRALAFKIVHFLQESDTAKSGNKILVRICLKDGQERKVFDQSRYLVPKKNELAVNLDLPHLPAGRYTVVIEVGDWLTGKTHTRILNAQLD
jgi:hypothetical protein